MPLTAIREFLNSFGSKLSQVECGITVKHAFPGLQRKRSNNKWYYYGLQCIDEKAGDTTLPDKPSSPNKETSEQQCENASQAACIDEQAVSRPNGSHEDTNATNAVHTCRDIVKTQVDLRPKNMQSSKQAEQQAYFRPFPIPSLNLCKEDMSDLTQGQLMHS